MTPWIKGDDGPRPKIAYGLRSVGRARWRSSSVVFDGGVITNVQLCRPQVPPSTVQVPRQPLRLPLLLLIVWWIIKKPIMVVVVILTTATLTDAAQDRPDAHALADGVVAACC